jgi:ABC-type sugar transport system ATPase subunit
MADKHLVEIAKAFSYNPKLLVLDEATSAIGETEVEKLKEAIDKFKTNGGSVIFISHRMKELFNFCDRCLILKDGKKVITETIGNLDKDSIVKYMTGRDLKQGYFPDKIDYNEIEKEKNVLEIVNLSTRSGVKNCNFSIRRGEIVGLGGLQGQGQIAFIQALFGMDKITSGSIIAADKKIKIRNTRDSIRNGLLLVPQDRKQEGLFIEDSVANNLVSCSLKKISTSGFIRNKQKNKLIREIVNRMNIKTGNWSQSMKSLSGGNQQKVALGKWLVHDAKVIMLIEPTRGIDITTKTEIYRLLRELSNKGYAIIISTNELLELVGISDRVIVMYERNMIAQLIGENISEEKIVAASFGEI